MIGKRVATRAAHVHGTTRITKYVDVEVDIDVDDVLSSLTDEQVRSLCRDRDIQLFEPDEGTFKIAEDDLRLVADRLMRGQVEDALLIFERLLPREFSFLSHDIARFYGARAS